MRVIISVLLMLVASCGSSASAMDSEKITQKKMAMPKGKHQVDWRWMNFFWGTIEKSELIIHRDNSKDKKFLLIPVFIDGRRFFFQLDTGGISYTGSYYLKHSGALLDSSGSNCKRKGLFQIIVRKFCYLDIDMRLEDGQLAQKSILTFVHSKKYRPEGSAETSIINNKLIGVLGQQFQKDKAVIIDYKNLRYAVLRGESYNLSTFTDTVQLNTHVTKQGMLFIKYALMVNSTRYKYVLFDTGSSDTPFSFRNKQDWLREVSNDPSLIRAEETRAFGFKFRVEKDLVNKVSLGPIVKNGIYVDYENLFWRKAYNKLTDFIFL